MAINFKLKNPEKILKKITDFKERVDQVIINRLIYVGETFVRNARENGNYLDQTGNLRSSIGYVVLKNGKSLVKDFKEANKGTDKVNGYKAAKALVKELEVDFKSGYALIVVAGMNYAAAVESKGRDVLTGSSIKAVNELKKVITKINDKL